VTVQGIISDPIYPTSTGAHPTNPRQAVSRKTVDTPLPLEIKTGRTIAGMEHRAQTMLYTLLLSERYGVDVQDGLLFYTQSEGGEVIRVPRGRNEIRGLIAARNEIAAYMWKRLRQRKSKKESKPPADSVDKGTMVELTVEKEEPFLPPPVDDERICKRCYVQDACFLFRKAHPNHSSSGKTTKFEPPIPGFLSGIFEAKTGHLTTPQIQFFRNWERLLAMEERELMRFKKELWTLGAEEREKLGRCFSGMVLVRGNPSKNRAALAQAIEDAGIVDHEESSEAVWSKEGKIHRWTYTFARSKGWSRSFTPSPPIGHLPTVNTESLPSQSLLDGHLNVGDPVTVSTGPLLALTRGYILELTPSEVVLGVDHALDLEAIRKRLRRDPSARNDPFGAIDDDVIFRIDKDELFGGMARVRNNLAQLFYVDGDRRRLDLVVDLRKPIFSEPDPPFCADEVARTSSLNLNPSQLAAMEKVLSAEDYALILGMPGTGKTTVIAALIKELVARGKTVLLSSYTHSAVDTILMKLTGDEGRDTDGADFGILRLGNVDKVHLRMKKYTLNAIKVSTVEQFERQIMSPPVVATTCLSIDQ
jgi:DNA replication ATP-dependent helicase Dna2